MKTTIKITKELRVFLESKGVLEQFIYNCEHDIYPIEDIYEDISGAFVWNEAPEDWDFWVKLSNEFNAIKIIAE